MRKLAFNKNQQLRYDAPGCHAELVEALALASLAVMLSLSKHLRWPPALSC